MFSSGDTKWLFLFASGCLLLGCQEPDQVVIESKPLGDPFQIAAPNYSTRYYFVDTSYIPSYEPYFLNDPPIVNSFQRITEVEVWVSRVGTAPDPREIHARAYLHLPAYNGRYPDSLRKGNVEPCTIEETQSVRLEPSEYEVIANGYLGIIRIAYPFSDYQSIAIAYTRSDGAQFGEFIRNVIDSSFFVSRVPILLKLVKPYNLPASGPYFKDAWRLLVKSIYSIGYSGVIKTQFHLDVFQQNARTLGQNSVLGQPLLTILGLDRYCSDGAPAPGGDGVFDYRPGRTIDQNHGDIILPYLRPFDDGIKRYFASIGHPVSPTSNVLLPQLYDSITTTLVQRSTFSYVFKGSALHQ